MDKKRAFSILTVESFFTVLAIAFICICVLLYYVTPHEPSWRYVPGFVAVSLVLVGLVLSFSRLDGRGGSRKKVLQQRFQEYKQLIISFGLLGGVAAFLSAYWFFSPNFPSSVAGFLPSLVSSFIEDLVFFGLLGVALVVVQKSDAYKSQRLSNRIDNLCNKCELSPIEREYMTSRIKEIAMHHISMRNQISIDHWDEANNLITLDIHREFEVESYLDDSEATYYPRVRIKADALPEGVQPGFLNYYQVSLGADKVDDVTKGAAPIPIPRLDEGPGQLLFEATEKITIQPDEVKTFKFGYTLTMPLSEAMSIIAFRSWNEMSIEVFNRTGIPFKISVSGRSTELFPKSPSSRVVEEKMVRDDQRFTLQFETVLIN